MSLGLSGIFHLLFVYFILACFICALGNTYSQNEIDNVFVKLIKREMYYAELDGQLGCWPQNVIPYTIQNGFSPDQIQNIYKHIYQIQNRTCLRWVEKSSLSGVKKQVEFVHKITEQFSCYTTEIGISLFGITTRITLSDRCFSKESVIHEMMHALGFLHEHQRIDRDCYVIVDEKYAQTTNFKIVYNDLSLEKWPYDKRSVTHYTRLSFALRDKDEPFGGLLWKYRLGDSYGWWGRIGKSYGKLTCLDAFKINYRFCGAPDFCATQPELCQKIEEEEKEMGCKDLYMAIAKGTAKPSGK